VTHSLMHNNPLEDSSSTLSSISNVSVANKTSNMNTTFVVHGNKLFFMNTRFLFWDIWAKVVRKIVFWRNKGRCLHMARWIVR
jgi:hypothetical protein